MKQKKQPYKGKADKRPAGSAVDTGAQKKLKNMLGILIAVFAFLLYAQSISFDYALDDTPMVKENKLVTQGFKAIPTLLKTDYWYGYVTSERIPEYRPASLIMFAIEWGLSPANPHLGHFMNVLLYALTCWLLFNCFFNYSKINPATMGWYSPFFVPYYMLHTPYIQRL